MEENAKNVTQEEKKEAITIDFNRHADFEVTADAMYTTTTLLAESVNAIMSDIYADYYGSDISVGFAPNMGYVVNARLVFVTLNKNAYDDENVITAFRPKYVNDGQAMINRIQRITAVNAPLKGKYEVTEDGKAGLIKFVYTKRDNKTGEEKVDDWMKVYDCQIVNNEQVAIYVNVDIVKLLKMVYGERGDNGDLKFYSVSPISPIGAYRYVQGPDGNMVPIAPSNWAINILRLHDANERKALERYGMNTNNTNTGALNNVVVAKRD